MASVGCCVVRHIRWILRVSTTILLLLTLAMAGKAEPIFPDGLFDAYMEAGNRVAKGEDRGAALVELRRTINQHPNSHHMPLARRLADDLAESITRAEARTRAGRTLEESPAEFLSESRMPLHLVVYEQNSEALNHYVQWHPRDPAVRLLAQGRNCIDQLLLQLENESPTQISIDFFTSVPEVPRVSTVALNLIETVSGCRFLRPGSPFPDKESEKKQRPELVAHIRKWWDDN